MAARPSHRHHHRSARALTGRRLRPVTVGIVALLFSAAVLGCSGGDDADGTAADATTGGTNGPTTSGAATSPTTMGPSLGTGDSVLDPSQTSLSGEGGATVGPAATASTAPPPTYIVPDIPAEAVPEICAATTQINEADAKIGDLLSPVLAADASTEADANLLAALGQAKPLVDQAQAGYDRMAAVLPGELAADAVAVRDATLTFYGAVTSAQTMDGLLATVTQAQAYSDSARESAARLDATTRKTCNQSLY